MKIDVKESIMVRPAGENPPGHSLWSSNLDLLVPRVHITTVYFYRRNGSSPDFFETRLLKESLSKVLVPFYPVAGRLRRDAAGRFEIYCGGDGVLFVEAEVDSIIDDFGDFTPCPELRRLVPTVQCSDDDDEISLHPLLPLQVTFFQCGGVSLGVGWHHTLADGFSALHFINAWSDVARGLSITVQPFINRSLLVRNTPSPMFHHTEYDPPPSMNTPIGTLECQSPNPTSTATLTITFDQLNALKANSNDNEDPTRYSSYVTLAAQVWRCACMARDLSDDQPTKLYIPTDGRSRFHPPLPSGYFGNVLFTNTSNARSSDLCSQPLKRTMENIHGALIRMNDDYLRSALDYIELQPDPTAMIRGAHTFRCPNLNVVSWVWLPVHDADFGWGKPTHMGPANVIFEGMAYILPSPSRDKSLSLVICLESHHLEVFKKLFYEF